MDKEIREIKSPVTWGKDNSAEGYGIVFWNPNDLATQFKYARNSYERINRDAVIEFEDDVLSTFNHKRDNLLGRTSSGTLKLNIDNKGIKYNLNVPDTTTGKDVKVLLDRRDLAGASAVFDIVKDHYETENGQRIHYLDHIKVAEIGVVVSPAYKATEAHLRSEQNYDEEIQRKINTYLREVDLLKLRS